MKKITLSSSLKVSSTLLLAIAVGTIGGIVGSLVGEAIDWSRLRLDDGVFALTGVLVTAVPILIAHRWLHRKRHAYLIISIIGAVLLSGGLFTIFRGMALQANHVPSGPFSGLGYALMVLAGIILSAVAVVTVLSSVCGIIGRRLEQRRPAPTPR